MKHLASRLLGAAALAATVSLLPACSDDSSSDKKSLTGSFVDSAVQGLRYQAEPSGLKGLTDVDGNFRYRAGDTVTFYIGDLPLGEVTGDELVTPADVARAEYDNSEDQDNFLLNVIRLLQTLDSDGDPDNGITISKETQAYFTSTNATAEVLAEIAGSLADNIDDFAAGTALNGVFDDADIDALVSLTAAQAHFTKAGMRGFWLEQEEGRRFLLAIDQNLRFVGFDDTNCGTGYEAQGEQAFDEYTSGDCREGADIGVISFDTETAIIGTAPCADCDGFVTLDSTGSSGLLVNGEGFAYDPVAGWTEFYATANTLFAYTYEDHDENSETGPFYCGEECTAALTRVVSNGSNPAFGLWQVDGEGEASFLALLNTSEGDIEYMLASFDVTPLAASELDEDNGVEHGYLDCSFVLNSCDLSVASSVFDGNGTAGLSSLPDNTTLKFIPGAQRSLDQLEVTIPGEGTSTLSRLL